MVLKELIFKSFYFGGDVVVLNEQIHNSFLLLEGKEALKELII